MPVHDRHPCTQRLQEGVVAGKTHAERHLGLGTRVFRQPLGLFIGTHLQPMFGVAQQGVGLTEGQGHFRGHQFQFS